MDPSHAVGARPCLQCGGPLPSASSRTRRYCSPRCRYAFRDRRRFVPAGSRVRAICRDCGDLFEFVQITKPYQRCPRCNARQAAPCIGCGAPVLSASPQPRCAACPRRCRCGEPTSTPNHRSCAGCRETTRELQVKQRRAERERQRDLDRGTSTERGYGAAHQRLRKAWAKKVKRGGVCCARCGKPIDPDGDWDLGHDDFDRTVYVGPEHTWCNRGTAKRRPGHRRPSRNW